MRFQLTEQRWAPRGAQAGGPSGGGVKGKFILSLNDTPGVRETFADFRIEAVKTRYSISGSSKQEAAEVLIRNFS